NKPRLQGARDGRRPSAGPATRRRSLRFRRATDPMQLGTRKLDFVLQATAGGSQAPIVIVRALAEILFKSDSCF
ncbi:MAG: hypothetical protein K2G93_05495, partial [Rikenella sp.]|nr:hypothetical protein [Rikenella sp.]